MQGMEHGNEATTDRYLSIFYNEPAPVSIEKEKEEGANLHCSRQAPFQTCQSGRGTGMGRTAFEIDDRKIIVHHGNYSTWANKRSRRGGFNPIN